MFNFVCKTLLFHSGRRCYITNTNYKHFPSSIFINFLSTTTPNQHSFTVSYLINSCGFSLQSALSASKRVHFDSPENPDSVIKFFKGHGFSETQISKVIRSHPQVLCARTESSLLPKLQFFNSKGFSNPELGKILSVCPNLICRSLENHIIPSFNYISDLFQTIERAVTAVKCNPFLLINDVGTTINVLRDKGVPERYIFLFLKRRYSCEKTRSGAFKNAVEVVNEMGISPSSLNFVLAVLAKLNNCGTHWESKVETYRRCGWSEKEFLAAFCKNPSCMLISKDKIMRAMDFLVNKMGLESSAIAKSPDVILYSMEKRLIPRATVFQSLLLKGLIKKKNTYLITICRLPEKAFRHKFLNSSPKLLKLYQEKLCLAKLTKKSIFREMDAITGE